MQFGVALPNFSRLGSRETVVEVARQAEALGFDSIWTTDHVMMRKGQEEPYGHILEALTTLTYLAALTERVRLGVSVIVFPQREPVLVAKQVATLDYLSGGRVVLGVGAGWNEPEFRFLGASFGDRGKRLDEYIRLLRELWTSPEPRFEGQYVQIQDALFSPRPVQEGGVPIVVGGNSTATFRRVATLADGWHPVGLSVEQVAEGARRIAERANGRAVSLSLRTRVAIDHQLPETRGADGRVHDTVCGTPEQIRAKIEAFRGVGVDEVVCYFWDRDAETFLAQMRRFAEEIRPRVG